MDFPIFHFDFIGNRMLIAITAIIHVMINHPMAVGAIPLATLLEWRAHKSRSLALDNLAYKITFVMFIITTTLGAMTGVGIWFTTSMVNPASIGSLLRVFFWAWFSEWIVFVLEVCFIMLYFLTWKRYAGERKIKHVRMGLYLSILSWLTMAVISAILAFMMDVGRWQPFTKIWTPASGLLVAFLNPLYGPQLFFRTFAALLSAGLFFMFLTPIFMKRSEPERPRVVRFFAGWVLALLPVTAVAAVFYWKRIPSFMADSAPIALATQDYTHWYGSILTILTAMVVIIALAALLGLIIPRRLPAAALVLPFVLSLTLLGTFERVREFIRKPFVIRDYMYSNGLRIEDYALYREDGILAHASFVRNREVTDENRLDAGREVFLLACSRCHTMAGINSVNKRFNKLFPGEWKEEQLSAFMENMHNVRVFMPPFPGTDIERDALAAYIMANRNRSLRLEGHQTAGFFGVKP